MLRHLRLPQVAAAFTRLDDKIKEGKWGTPSGPTAASSAPGAPALTPFIQPGASGIIGGGEESGLMVEFEHSEWSRAEFAAEFVENADHYIVERRRMLEVVLSFYRRFTRTRRSGRDTRLLDLGSGDGALSHELLKNDGTIRATLVDASPEMLECARRRLRSYPHVEFVERSFQQLLRDPDTPSEFDIVVSGLAIHHLELEAKKALFSYVFAHLDDGGDFVNLDVALAPDASLEDWYMVLWHEWIRQHAERAGRQHEFDHVPQQYKTNPDNLPDTLDDQLSALRAVGFEAVDCYYKYGVFVVFGGRKPRQA